MAKKTTSQVSNFERTYNILKYLKKNSDSEHKVTQAMLRKDEDLDKIMGDKQTFNRMIINAAMALNNDKDDIKPEDEWNFIF